VIFSFTGFSEESSPDKAELFPTFRPAAGSREGVFWLVGTFVPIKCIGSLSKYRQFFFEGQDEDEPPQRLAGMGQLLYIYA
jgi:hypothetical protein